MDKRVDTFIIRGADGLRFSNSLVLGRGVLLNTTEGGIPELAAFAGELAPSGRDDTAAIVAALADPGAHLRLGPGTFRVSAPITVPGNRTITGRGAAATTLLSSHAGSILEMGGDSIRIEELTLTGPGSGVAGSQGVALAGIGGGLGLGSPLPVSGIRLRAVAIGAVEAGVVLAGSDLELATVRVSGVSANGISLSDGERVSISNLTVTQATGGALLLANVTGVDVVGMTARGCGAGIGISGSFGCAVSGVNVVGGSHGVTVASSSITQLSGVSVDECATGFIVVDSAGVSLNGCGLVRGTGTPLTITGGSFDGFGIAVSAFYAESSGSAPLVVVNGGAKGVTIHSIHHRPTGTTRTWDVDTTAAGGRVVFIQHDFAANRINSGGNFVAL